MKLYERLLKIIEFFEENSQTKFAKRIGISQTTFWGYLNQTGQSKIRLDLLNKIVVVYPQISRNWLYFGEGEMLVDNSSQAILSPNEMPAISIQDERIQQLEHEVLGLQKELLEAKDKIIALHEERALGREGLTVDAGTRARGVHSHHHDSDKA